MLRNLRPHGNGLHQLSKPAGIAAAAILGLILLASSAAGACTIQKGNEGFAHTTAAISATHSFYGTVGAVNSTSFTLNKPDGKSLSVVVTSSTVLSELGRMISLTSLTTGEHVKVAGSSDPTTATLTASKVEVVLARIAGTVTSVSSSNFVLSDIQGFARTVVELSSTTYMYWPSVGLPAPTAASIAMGERVVAMGTIDPNGTSLDAASVTIRLAHLVGAVSSLSSSGFVVVTHASATTVGTSSSTVYMANRAIATSSAVVVGDTVILLGTQSATSSSFSAMVVDVMSPPIGHVASSLHSSKSNHHFLSHHCVRQHGSRHFE